MSNRIDQSYKFDVRNPGGNIYALLRNGFNAAGSTVQLKSGSWVTDLTMAAQHVPHAIHGAPDGTLWMVDAYQFSAANRFWRKLVGGAWVEIATHPWLAMSHIQAISADEVWGSDGRYVTRWTTAGGFTTWDLRALTTASDFADCIFHYISPTNVIAVGIDYGPGLNRVAKWDGVSWSVVSSFSGGGFYSTAIHVDGNDLWVGVAGSLHLFHHPALGVGAGWTSIDGTGFPVDAGVAKTVTGIYGSATDLWVSIETATNESDVLRSLDNGATAWTGYIRNPAYGCVGLIGDGSGKIYVGHIGVQTISVWDGASWSTDEPGGTGTFRGWILPSQWDRGYPKLAILPVPPPDELLEIEKTQTSPGVRSILRDDFSTESRRELFTPFGTASASGGALALHLDVSESGDRFANDTFAVPHASFELGSRHEDIIEIESACSVFTGSNTQRIYGMALIDSEQTKHSYYQFLYREDIDRVDVERGLQGAGHINIANVGFGTFNGQHRMRIIWNRVEGTLGFWMSNNNGSSWTHIHQRTADFQPSSVILYIRQFASNPSVDVTFDYLEVRAGALTPKASSPGPGTVSVVADAVAFPAGSLGEQPDHGGHGLGGALFNEFHKSTSEDAVGFPARAQEGVLDHGGHGLGGALLEARSGIKDGVSYLLDGPADFTEFRQDGDGNDLLGGVDLRQVLKIDTTLGSFGSPLGNPHYGAAADGTFYENGVACGPGDFGAGGIFRRTAWRRGGDEPFAARQDSGVQPSLIADDTLRFGTGGTMSGFPQASPSIHTNKKWVLQGDFIIDVDFANWNPISGNDLIFSLQVLGNSGEIAGKENGYNIHRRRESGSEKYQKYILNNGVATSVANISTTDTAGTLRIERSGTTFRAFYFVGATPTQLGADDVGTANVGSGDLYVRLWFTANNSTNGTVDASNFTIQSGTTSNKAGWYREAASTTRGVLPAMPASMGAVFTATSLDLLDLATNKLWMRFVKGVSNIVFTSLNGQPRRLAWDAGQLLLAQGSNPLDTPEGMATLVDFTADHSRIYREVASIAGAFYGSSEERAIGGIALRNSAGSWTAFDVLWVIPDHRTYDVALYRSGGFEYHAMATADGASVGKWQRWYTQAVPSVGTSKSSEVTVMLAVLLDSLTGELFYMDDTTLHSVPRATYEGVMPTTQIFSAATTKVLPGTRTTDQQHHLVRFGANIMVPAQEGIYDVVWPGGSFTLLYGEVGSGATHEILPANSGVRAIAHALDGITNLLICGLESAGTAVAVINLDTNTLYGIIPPEVAGKAPVSVAG